MFIVMTTAMASALALASAAPLAAQDYEGSPYRPTDEYQQQQRDYDNQRAQYEQQRDAYRANRADYEAARAAYNRRRADWEAARAAYDARYGYGSYVRVYGPAPVWDERHWTYYAVPARGYYATPSAGYYAAPASGYYAAPSAGYYGADTAYAAPVHCNNNAAVTAGVIGAIAGGVLGSNIAHHGDRTAGTVLGALVGGGVGAAVGHSHDVQKCDARGAYYAYGDTIPYRVDNDVYRDPSYAYYQRRGCRLAPAAVNDTDYRYVRVCPDPDGRFRVTG
jgi:hypothetical protein